MPWIPREWFYNLPLPKKGRFGEYDISLKINDFVIARRALARRGNPE